MNSSFFVCGVCGTVNPRGQTRCMACKQPLSEANEGKISSFASPAFPRAKKVLKQRYRILFIVGKGGMGTVYIGKDMQLGNRLVAIKEMSQDGLLPSDRRQAAQNFQHEAHLLAGLQHPNLPGIYDHFEEGQRWYLVMSFIKGQTLEEYLESKGGLLPVEEVLEIGIVLCNVLQYLHSHHPPIIFRDLKPSNIMRTADGHIYLIDFGIARFFKIGQSKDTNDRGSPGYAAPEQYGKTQTTPSSDIYSLGVIFYQMFSGHYITTTTFHFPPLESLAPNVPPPITRLVTQMLDIDERKRPQSVEIVKQELQNYTKTLNAPVPPVTPKNLTRDNPIPPTLVTRRPKSRIAPYFIAVGVGLLLLILLTFILNGTLFNANTPYGVVNTFCNAMNSSSPDFQTAYNQFSSQYQRKHSLVSFQEYYQGTIQCAISSAPNEKNMAELNLVMSCPPIGGPPPGAPPPTGPPPPQNKPTNLTLIHDGNNGWRIETIFVVGYNCDFNPRGIPPPRP